jgi:hypothetical protein
MLRLHAVHWNILTGALLIPYFTALTAVSNQTGFREKTTGILFTGQGAQFPRMGQILYRTESVSGTHLIRLRLTGTLCSTPCSATKTQPAARSASTG